MLAAFAAVGAAFPDTHHIIHDLIAEGDRVVARVSAAGVHAGSLDGEEPSGRRIHNDAIVVYRLENGRIAERWSRERESILEQIGAVRCPR